MHRRDGDVAYGTDARGQRRFETATAPSPADVEAVLREPTEVRRLLCYLRCFSDPLPVSPSRGPPDWPDTLDFP